MTPRLVDNPTTATTATGDSSNPDKQKNPSFLMDNVMAVKNTLAANNLTRHAIARLGSGLDGRWTLAEDEDVTEDCWSQN